MKSNIWYPKQKPISTLASLSGGAGGFAFRSSGLPTPYSVDFDGNDYLNIVDDADFELGTTNFTVEAWYYADSSMNTGQYNTIISMGWPFQLYWHDKQFKFWASSDGATNNYFVSGHSFLTGNNTAPQDGWNHIAVTRSGSTFRMFLNGALMSTATSSTAFGNPQHDAAIGRFAPNNNLYATGKVSNLRLVKGTALYTSYFTPSASALTNVTNTVLLCCNESTVTGSTVTPSTITAVGNPASSTSVPFDFNSYSVDFDGNGDDLEFASSTDFTMGTGNFTWEAWLKPASWSNNSWNTVFNAGTGSDSGSLWIGQNNSNEFVVRAFNVADQLTCSTLPSVNQWTHVAASRSGSTLKLFYNGTQQESVSNSYNFTSGSAIFIGQDGHDARFTGKVSNLRLVKGQALYTSNFTAPTEPLYVTSASADPSNVKLLCCNQATTTESSKTPGTITANGNPTVSTDTPFA